MKKCIFSYAAGCKIKIVEWLFIILFLFYRLEKWTWNYYNLFTFFSWLTHSVPPYHCIKAVFHIVVRQKKGRETSERLHLKSKK